MTKRLLALDIFRGMTIFFMIIVNTPGSWQYVYPPLLHAKWNGLTPTDLVFPFFMFIVGVSMAISFSKFDLNKNSKLYTKVLRRTALIFLIGILLNWFPFFNKSMEELRIMGVLQRIALGYGFASFIVLLFNKKWLPLIFSVLLLGYYFILLKFGDTSPLSLEGNAVKKLDLFLLGENHIYKGYGIPFDPEGILSTLPSIGTVLFGYWIGLILRSTTSMFANLKQIFFYALGGILLGLIWNFVGFPINKPIWSSSYVLVTGGLAVITLIGLIWIIDIRGYKDWTFVFNVFGRNSLFSYMLSGLFIKTFSLIKIGEQGLYSWLYSNLFQKLGDMSGSFIQALCYTFFVWLFAFWLYKKDVLIKL